MKRLDDAIKKIDADLIDAGWDTDGGDLLGDIIKKHIAPLLSDKWFEVELKEAEARVDVLRAIKKGGAK